MGTWTTGTPKPTTTTNFGCTTDGRYIYCIGGLNQADRSYSNANEYYDTQSNVWHFGESMPSPRTGLACAHVKGKIYAFGGSSGSGTAGLSDKVEIYDIESNTWSLGPSMPAKKMGLSCSVCGDKIFCIGGVNYITAPLSPSFFVFDTNDSSWSEKAELPVNVHLASSVIVGSKLYVVGGQTIVNGQPTANIKAIQIYDIPTDTWSLGAEMEYYRTYIVSGVLNEKIYIIGGSTLVEAYNIKSDAWEQIEDAPFEHFALINGVRVDEKFYVIGGNREFGAVYTDHVDIFEPGNTEPPTPSPKCCCTKVKLQIETCTCNQALLDDLNAALRRDGERGCGSCCK